jgi:hypothetical protein
MAIGFSGGAERPLTYDEPTAQQAPLSPIRFS